MQKDIEIPEKIKNEIVMLDNLFDEYAASMNKFKRKMDMTKMNMWDIMSDVIPEINVNSCSFNRKEMTVSIIDNETGPNPKDFLRKLLE